MRQLFSTDGIVYRFLTTTGNIILATILWMIGCIPVITIGVSTAALYYTIVKSVRRDVGYVHSEFWRGYRLNFKKGVAATAALLALGILLGLELWLVLENGVEVSRIWYTLSGLLILPFVMSIRFWYITLALAAGLILTAAAQLYILPIPLILLTPGLWCYASSFLVEKAMKAYMPKPQQEQDGETAKNWYDD